MTLIEHLVASGLIVETPEETYRFSHDKLRQALYEDIGSHRRRELHLGWPGHWKRLLASRRNWPTTTCGRRSGARRWRALCGPHARRRRSITGMRPLRTTRGRWTSWRSCRAAGEKRFELLAARERLLEHMDRREERARIVGEMFELANRMGDRTRIAQVCVRRIGVLAALSNLELPNRPGGKRRDLPGAGRRGRRGPGAPGGGLRPLD